MLAPLKSFFRNDWVQYGESLQLIDSRRAQPSVAQWLMDPLHLKTALTRHAHTLNDARAHKAVASDWQLRYLTALLPPIIALSSLLKYCVPTSTHDMVLLLNESGVPAVFAIADLGTVMPRANAAERYNALVWLHLEPLITHLTRETKTPSKILWGNARRALLSIFGHALSLVSADASLSATLIDDRRLLLESPLWTDGRRNPLFLRHRHVSVEHQGGERLLTLHANCCLAYQLPDTGYCGACPLAPQYRKRARQVVTTPAAAPIRRDPITA